MRIFPVQVSHTTLLSMFLPVVLAACGCRKAAIFPSACENIDIQVHDLEKHGVDKKAVYLCPGKHITWKIKPGADDKSFTVEFVSESFGGDLPDFGTGNPTKFNSSNGVASTPDLQPLSPNELTVFKYKITITDNHNATKTFDPHVVGGGS